MQVPEGVHVEIHLAVGTHAVMVYPQQGQLCQYVVNRSDRHFGAAVFGNLGCHHICRSMPQIEHGLMHGQSLLSGLQVVFLQYFLELVNA